MKNPPSSSIMAQVMPVKNSSSIAPCPDTWAEWYCLNGATCFTVRINDSVLYNCWCPVGFHGLRCDYKYLERRGNPPKEEARVGEMVGLPLPRRQDRNDDDRIGNKGYSRVYPTYQSTKELYSLMLNLLIVLLVLFIFLLVLRILKKRGSLGAALMAIGLRRQEGPSNDLAQGAGQDNNNGFFIDLDQNQRTPKQIITELNQFTLIQKEPPNQGGQTDSRQLKIGRHGQPSGQRQAFGFVADFKGIFRQQQQQQPPDNEAKT